MEEAKRTWQAGWQAGWQGGRRCRGVAHTVRQFTINQKEKKGKKAKKNYNWGISEFTKYKSLTCWTQPLPFGMDYNRGPWCVGVYKYQSNWVHVGWMCNITYLFISATLLVLARFFVPFFFFFLLFFFAFISAVFNLQFSTETQIDGCDLSGCLAVITWHLRGNQITLLNGLTLENLQVTRTGRTEGVAEIYVCVCVPVHPG